MPPRGEEHLSKLDRRRLVDKKCREALVSGQRVCVDLSMEHLMSDKVMGGGSVEVNTVCPHYNGVFWSSQSRTAMSVRYVIVNVLQRELPVNELVASRMQ